MRNNKLWSVLLAAVLLCACVVGVLFVGSQAQETMYTWNVNGTTDVSSEDKNEWTFATVQEAVQKAYEIRAQWTATDALTIALGSNQTITAGVNGGTDDQRKIFNVNSIFRAAGDFLPITIDGGAETKYSLDFNITDLKANGTPQTKDINCTNEYTFKNLSLPWGNDPVNLYAGCAQVTFDTCTFSEVPLDSNGSPASKSHLSAGAATVLALNGINKTHWDAMKQPGLDGKDVLVSKLTFINTDASSLGNWHVHNQYNLVAFKSTGGAVIQPENIQSVIEVGNGGKVARTSMIAGTNVVPTFGVADDPATEANEAKTRTAYNELVFRTLNGADMRGLFGVYGLGESASARKAPHANFTFDFQGGSNTSTAVVCVAQQNLDVVGNLHVILGQNFTSNATQLFEVLQVNYNATLDGDVVVDINGNSLAKPIAGPRGGELKGDMTVNINSGNITNYALNDGIANGSSIAGKISGTLTTNMYGGNITNFAAIGDTRVASVGKIVNNFYGGRIGTADGASGYCFGGSDTISLTCDIENHYLGTTFTNGVDGSGGTYGGSKQNSVNGTITNYYGEKDGDNPVHITTSAGYCGGNQLSGGTVTKVINHFENVTFSCTNYAGGRSNGGTTIENYFYDGFKHTANDFYCGTNNASAAHTVYNYFLGGESTYTKDNHQSTIYGGSASASPANVYNYFLGGTYNMILGGTKTGAVKGAVTNNFCIDKDGNVGGNFKVTTFFGGASGKAAIETINNNIGGGEITTFYGGNAAVDSGAAGTVTTINNTISGGEIATFYGANAEIQVAKKTVVAVATATTVNNTISGGETATFYGGGAAGTVGTITNNVNGGKVVSYYGGSKAGAVTTINNNYKAGTLGKDNAGTGADAGLTYGGSLAGTVGTINNHYFGTEFLSYTFSGGDKNDVTDIDNNIDVFHGSFFGGNRAGTAVKVTTVSGVEGNDIEDDLNFTVFYGGSRGGPVTGTISTTLNGGTYGNFYGTGSVKAAHGAVSNTLKNVTIINFCGTASNAGVTSTSVTTTLEGANIVKGAVLPDGNGGCPDATLTIKDGASFTLYSNGAITATTVEGAVTLTQTEYWRDGLAYFTGDTANVTVTDDDLYGSPVITANAVTGSCGLTRTHASLLLSSRVALRMIYEQNVADVIDFNFVTAHVNGKEVKIEIDPEAPNAIIVYGIGLKDFDKDITFAGKLPALPDAANTIIEISDHAVNYLVEQEKEADALIYKAIADFGRVYLADAKKPAIYGLEPAAVTSEGVVNSADRDVVTGKNLVMSDALGFRYYVNLTGENTIDDIKVSVDGADVTALCNKAFYQGSETKVAVDFYVSIVAMDQDLNVVITVGEETVLDCVEYGDALAQKIIAAQPTNVLAKAALVYIQAAAQL